MKESIPDRILVRNKFWANGVADYVVSRQNADGGYTFVQGNESNAQDTYYGLAILRLLDSSFPKIERTLEWLHGFELRSVYSYYYVGKALSFCAENPDNQFRSFVASKIASKEYFGSVNFYFEVASEFRLTLMILELADLLGVEKTDAAAVDWLLRYRNRDGGFGTRNQPNVISTYYAVASLRLLNYDLRNLKSTLQFLRKCEPAYGGFTVVPHSSAPYMEHTYYGTMSIDILGERCRFPSETVDFALKCQNANGGFARSDLGISTFENTFQALSVLQKLAPSLVG